MDHEHSVVLWECHNGVGGRQVGGKSMTQKVLYDRLCCPTVFKDSREYARSCDACQRVGRPFQRDELPSHLVRVLQAFQKWDVDFTRPIYPPSHHSHAHYIITSIDYLTRWAEVEPV